MTNTKTKTFFASILLIIMAVVLFAGCGQVTSLTTVYADGSRSYSYAITLDDAVLETYDLNKTEVMSAINNVVNTYQEAFFAGRNTEGVELTHGVAESNDSVYQILLTFSSFNALCHFLGTTPEEVAAEPAVINKGVFVSQEVIADSSLDSSDELLVEMFLIPSLIDNINTAFANYFFNGDRTVTDQLFNSIDTYIVRAYPASLKIKSNADEVATLITNYGITDSTPTAYTAHLWHCTMAEPVPNIYIYRDVYLNENRIAWYLLGIGITIVFGAILAIVLYVRHKQGKDDTPTEPAFTVIDNGTALIFEPKNAENTNQTADNTKSSDKTATNSQTNNPDSNAKSNDQTSNNTKSSEPDDNSQLNKPTDSNSTSSETDNNSQPNEQIDTKQREHTDKNDTQTKE